MGSGAPWEPDTAIVFVGSAFEQEYSQVVPELRRRVPSLRRIVGCSGMGVIGLGQDSGLPEEVENTPGLSVTLARLPQVDVSVRHLAIPSLPDGDAPPGLWSELTGVPAFSAQPTSFVVMADPSFLRLQDLLAGLDFAHPQANVVGGLASAAPRTPARSLFCWDAEAAAGFSTQGPQGARGGAAPRDGMHRTGAVVLGLHGGVRMDLLVAQGCRPLCKSGSTWVIERAHPDSSTILAVRREGEGGAARGEALTPLAALQQDLREAVGSEEELRHVLRNLTLGLAPETLAGSEPLGPQDFLIRAMGLDPAGHVAVGDYIRIGQRIRFMVRDKQGAQEDLKNHGLAYKRRELSATLEGRPLQPAIGSLLFSCTGRGSSLYHEPHYDSRTLSSFVPVPVSGFHCNGEVGKVGRTTHLHGFTCAMAVLRQVLPAAGGAPTPGSAAGAEGSGAWPSGEDAGSSGPCSI